MDMQEFEAIKARYRLARKALEDWNKVDGPTRAWVVLDATMNDMVTLLDEVYALSKYVDRLEQRGD